MDAEALAHALRSDPMFRRRALTDTNALLTEHGLAVPLLVDVTTLLAHPGASECSEWCEEHAALFALIASARGRPQ
jgi:hypothetical protein